MEDVIVIFQKKKKISHIFFSESISTVYIFLQNQYQQQYAFM